MARRSVLPLLLLAAAASSASSTDPRLLQSRQPRRNTPSSWGGPTPPSWGQTWSVANSTAFYGCNYAGLLDPSLIRQFRLVQLDWSNAKEVWANAHPMDSADLLTRQAAAVKAGRPDAVVGVYRNTVKALSWFPAVRDALADPARAGLFLPFRPGGGGVNSSTVVPACDTNYAPPRCSPLYHDENQTPQYRVPSDGINGTCTAAPCDCGAGVPCGEYLTDHRNASARAFVVDDVRAVLSNPNVTMLYLDDYWVDSPEPINPDGDQPAEGYCTHGPVGGPSEIQLNCTDDMGLGQADVTAIKAGWESTFSQVYDVMDEMGAYAYLGFTFVSTPGPGEAAATIRALCAEGTGGAQYNAAAQYLLTTPAECCPPDRNTTLLQFEQDLAFFQLVRGPWSFVGYGWEWCATDYQMPPGLFLDYGDPLGTCAETAPGSGVFSRPFTRSTAFFDTNVYAGNVTMK
jgi:hypothetical protein